MQLVEEAIDGGWIGHLARMSAQNSEIGSVYSPPTMQQHSDDVSQPASGGYVETIVEIGYREKVCSQDPKFSWTNDLISCVQGWLFKCERGGIRRVLMNLLGNSLKFTYVS
jgi:signal transduction histidine kinase